MMLRSARLQRANCEHPRLTTVTSRENIFQLFPPYVIMITYGRLTIYDYGHSRIKKEYLVAQIRCRWPNRATSGQDSRAVHGATWLSDVRMASTIRK